MTIKGEYVPLSLLIPSLESTQKLYFLYRKAAETGTRGAKLRFYFFKQSLPDEEREKLEGLFNSVSSAVNRRTA